ncbi:MAG: hypothetical protein ABGY41_09475, partial [Candidatus Poribacteria bacterium]
MGMTLMSGYFFAGTTSCAAFKFSRDASSARADNQECKDELNAFKGEDADGGDPTLHGLTQHILGAPDWKLAISNDAEFRAAYADNLNTIFEDSERKLLSSDVFAVDKHLRDTLIAGLLQQFLAILALVLPGDVDLVVRHLVLMQRVHGRVAIGATGLRVDQHTFCHF